MTTLTPDLKRRFRLEGFAALYVAGTKDVVAKRVGDNQGSRPITLGVTKSWGDTITKHIDRHSPLWWNGVLFRIWCESEEHADLLHRIVASYLQKYDPLRKSWFDMGPAFSPAKFEWAIRKLAEDRRIRTWNDKELVAYVNELVSKEARNIKRAYAE